MEKMKKLIVLLTLGLLMGCSEKEEVVLISKEYVGILQDCRVVPVAFNDYTKVEIKTDRFYGVINSTPTFYIGDSTFICHYSNGRSYIGTSNSKSSYKINL